MSLTLHRHIAAMISLALLLAAPTAGRALDVDLAKRVGPKFYKYDDKTPSVAGLCWELWLSDSGPELRAGGFSTGATGSVGLKASESKNDAVTAQATFSASPGLTISVSRLTPAALVRGGHTIDLFVGPRHRPAVHEYSRVKPVPTAAIPRFFALADGRVRPIAELIQPLSQGLEQGWILFWWGEASPWIDVFGNLGQEQSRKLDLPLLVVFRDGLMQIQATGVVLNLPAGSGGDNALGVRFDFGASEGRLAVAPLYGKPVILGGDALPPADPATPLSTWKDKLPEPIVKRCRELAEHLCEVPTELTKESVEYDRNADLVTIRSTVKFDRVRTGGKRLAPLPATLVQARQSGMKVNVAGTLVVTELATPFGPYAGVEGTDTASYTVSGLGKYVIDQRAYGNSPTPKTVQDALNQEADRILQVGILAPPFYFLRHGPADPEFYHQFRERLVFSNPGFNLYILAQLAEAVDPQRREKLLALMKEWRSKYPPETVAHQPHGDGRRERSDLFVPLAVFQRWPALTQNFHSYNKIVPAESLYYLAEYYRATGEKPDKTPVGMSAFYLSQLDWASGGFFRWGERLQLGPWKFYDRTYGRNLVLELNAFMAGMIGQIRLARLTGDAAAEAEAWHALSGVAMLRFVAAHHVTEGTCDERGVSGSYAGGSYSQGFLASYYEIVPEVGHFLHDHAKADVKRYCDLVAVQVPDWYRTFCDVMWIPEQAYMYPSDADQVFSLHAWVLRDADPVTLFRWCDIPWVPTGDMYYIGKLVETKRAYQGWEWK